jgi:hypothetical protein
MHPVEALRRFVLKIAICRSSIKRLKDPDEKRGKSKLPNSVEAKAMDVEKPEQSNVASTEITVAVIPEIAPEIMPDESVIAEYDEPNEEVDPNELAKHYEAYEKEMATLKLENERLKKRFYQRMQGSGNLRKRFRMSNGKRNGTKIPIMPTCTNWIRSDPDWKIILPQGP